MVRNNFMMHICTVATLCFPDKTVPRNYYYCVQDDNSLSLCFKSMYRTLFVAIFTSTFIFSMFKSSHTYRNINISNLCRQKRIFGHLQCVWKRRILQKHARSRGSKSYHWRLTFLWHLWQDIQVETCFKSTQIHKS